MKPPLIGLTTREYLPGEDTIPYLCARRAYVDSILAAGGAPILVPHTARGEKLERIFELLDGVVLTGGEDVEPLRYGQPPHPKLGAVDPQRDEGELALITMTLAAHKPLLAVCRGMQILNVALGGTLYQDLDAEHSTPTLHREGAWDELVHELRIEPQSQLASVLGTTRIGANSLHHQAVRDLAPRLRATATTDDGLIEACELSGERFCLAVQCHPETLWNAAEPRWLNLFRELIQAAREAGSRVPKQYQALEPYRP